MQNNLTVLQRRVLESLYRAAEDSARDRVPGLSNGCRWGTRTWNDCARRLAGKGWAMGVQINNSATRYSITNDGCAALGKTMPEPPPSDAVNDRIRAMSRGELEAVVLGVTRELWVESADLWDENDRGNGDRWASDGEVNAADFLDAVALILDNHGIAPKDGEAVADWAD